MLLGRPELGGGRRGHGQKDSNPNFCSVFLGSLKLTRFSCPGGDNLKCTFVYVVLMFYDRVGKASLCFIWVKAKQLFLVFNGLLL